MGKSKRNRNRIGNTRKLETQKGNPLKQIRLTDANFAARLAGKYAWNIGPAGRKAQLFHRTTESGSSSLIVPLTLRLFIPLIQVGMKVEQLRAPVLSSAIVQTFNHHIRPQLLPSGIIQPGLRRKQPAVMQLHHSQQAYAVPEQAKNAVNLLQTIVTYQTALAGIRAIASSAQAAMSKQPAPALNEPTVYQSFTPGFSAFRTYRIRETEEQTRSVERHLSEVLLNRRAMIAVQETLQRTRHLHRRVTEIIQDNVRDTIAGGARGMNQRLVLDKGATLLHVLTGTKEIQDIFSVFRSYRIRETEEQTRSVERHLSQVMLNRRVLEAVQETVQKTRHLSRRVTEIIQDNVQDTIQKARRFSRRVTETVRTTEIVQTEEQAVRLVPKRADTITDSVLEMKQRLMPDKGATLLHVMTGTKEIQDIFSVFRSYRIREKQEQIRSMERRLSQVMLNRRVLEAVQETVQKARHLSRRVTEIIQENVQDKIQKARRFNRRVTETVRTTEIVQTEEQAVRPAAKRTDTITGSARGLEQHLVLDKGATLLHVMTGTKEIEDIFNVFRSYRIRETEEQTRSMERRLSQIMLNRRVLEAVQASVQKTRHLSRRMTEVIQRSVQGTVLESVQRTGQLNRRVTEIMQENIQETIQKARRLNRRVTETVRTEEKAVRLVPKRTETITGSVRGLEQRQVLDRGATLLHVISGTKEIQDIFSFFRSYRIRETSEQTRSMERHLSQVMLNRRMLEAVQESVQRTRLMGRRVTETIRESAQEIVQESVDNARRINRRVSETVHAMQQNRRLTERLETIPVIDIQTLRTIRNIRETSFLELKELAIRNYSITEKMNIHRHLSFLERSRSYINSITIDNRSGQPSPARPAAAPFVVAKTAQTAASTPPEVVVQKRSAAAAPLEVAAKRTAVANYEPVVKQLHTSIQKIEEDLSKAKSEWSKPQKPDIRKLTDEVYRALAGRLRFEQQRRGF